MGRRVALGLLAVVVVAASAASGFLPGGLRWAELHAAEVAPAFEVVSIRPWKPAAMPVAMAPPPPADGTRMTVVPRERVVPIPGPLTSDRLGMVLPTRMLIAFAYGLPLGSENHVLGGPEWLDSEQYEIHAKIEDSMFAALKKEPREQQREQVERMERTLLEERFHLQAHREMREGAVFALTAAKGGPRLTASKEGETPKLSLMDVDGGLRMTATAIPLEVWLHSPFLGGRPIVDETGLKGTYDFQLTWRPVRAADGVREETTGAEYPPLLEAIEQQLGLKLTPAKGPVEMIVVDHVERPSPN